jgi:hypothetical protein
MELLPSPRESPRPEAEAADVLSSSWNINLPVAFSRVEKSNSMHNFAHSGSQKMLLPNKKMAKTRGSST